MIKSFRSKALSEFYETGKGRGIRPDLRKRVQRRLNILHAARKLEDVNVAGLRLHRLSGVRAGRYAIDVSGPWRMTFAWEGEYAVLVDLEQYH